LRGSYFKRKTGETGIGVGCRNDKTMSSLGDSDEERELVKRPKQKREQNGEGGVVKKRRIIDLDDFGDDESDEIRPGVSRERKDERGAARESDDEDDDEEDVGRSGDEGGEVRGEEVENPLDDRSAQALDHRDGDSDSGEAEHDPGAEIVEEAPITRELVEIRPKFQTDVGPRKEVFKASNVLGISFPAFDPETFDDEQEDDRDSNGGGTSRIGGVSGAVIRWRLKDQKTPLRDLLRTPLEDLHHVIESNARIVEWEDGSQTLHVGKDAFYIQEDPISDDTPLHLYRRFTSVQVSRGRISSKLRILPADPAMLALSQAGQASSEKNARKSGVAMSAIIANPEKEEREALKEAAQREKARSRLEAAQRRKEQRQLERAVSLRGDRGGRARYLEDGNDSEEADDYDYEQITVRSKRNQETSRREREDPSRLLSIMRSGEDSHVKRKRRVVSDDEGSD